jgi:hypothetical protein
VISIQFRLQCASREIKKSNETLTDTVDTHVTSAAEGYYARSSRSGRDFKMLSRLGVKHAKILPECERQGYYAQTATTPSAKPSTLRHEKLDYARHHEMATASGNVEI